MTDLEKKELVMVVGGAISGSLINSFMRSINTLLDLGRSLGTAIRRISSNNICSL